MSVVAHFFVVVGGSKIHDRLAHFFIDIYTNGNVRLFFICYFNDLICPLFFFSYANMLLNTVDKEINRIWAICLVSLCTSCVWEFVAPFIKPSSITDPLDIVCYMTGGIMYWAILRCIKIRTKNTGVICDVEG